MSVQSTQEMALAAGFPVRNRYQHGPNPHQSSRGSGGGQRQLQLQASPHQEWRNRDGEHHASQGPTGGSGRRQQSNRRRYYKKRPPTAGGAANTTVLIAAVASATTTERDWVWDCGAEMHICKDKSLMENLRLAPGKFKTASGPLVSYDYRGDVVLFLKTDDGIRRTILSNAILHKEGHYNLFSVESACAASGGKEIRDWHGQDGIYLPGDRAQLAACITVGKRRFLAVADTKHQDDQVARTETVNAAVARNKRGPESMSITTQKDWFLWHVRLGHASPQRVKATLQELGFVATGCPDSFACDTCSATKFQRPSFSTGNNVTQSCLDIVTSDVCGPMPVPSFGGAKYILTITDVHTRFLWTFAMRTKGETSERILKWLKEVKGTFGHYPKVFRSDNGGEFTSQHLQSRLMDMRIERQTTAAYTPQQNGISERVNRTILNMVRALLKDIDVPQAIWAEAVRHATWLKNRTYSSVIKGIPYQALYDRKPRTHMKQARHLLRFVKATMASSLTYSSHEDSSLIAYTDSDHAGSWKEDAYSTSGYVAILLGGAVAWRSRRQKVLTKSTAEAEIVAASDAAHEVDTLIDVLRGLGLVEVGKPVKLLIDNQAAEKHCSTSRPLRNKALTLRSASVKDLIQRQVLDVKWIPNHRQKADGFTKHLPHRAQGPFRHSIGVLSPAELLHR